MKQYVYIIMLWLIIAGCISPVKVKAESMEDKSVADQSIKDIDFSEIQAVIDETLGEQNRFSFRDYVIGLYNGTESFSFSAIFKHIVNQIKEEISEKQTILITILSIGFVAAVFSNLSGIFGNEQISEVGFYITYLLLFTVLMGAFSSAVLIAEQTITIILSFMKVLVPAFFLAIAFTSGASTSLIFYEASLISIQLVDTVLIRFAIPIINIYCILTLANYMTKEDMLSKLIETLELVIKWGLKTVFAFVIGFHSIQGLIAPVADSIKKSILLKAANSIPGAGGLVSSAAQTVYGTGLLVKNAIGAAGLVVIVILVALPIIKLTIYTMLYRVSAALIQPISDKRLLECLCGVSRAIGFLLYVVLIGAILFFVSIGIITIVTTST